MKLRRSGEEKTPEISGKFSRLHLSTHVSSGKNNRKKTKM